MIHFKYQGKGVWRRDEHAEMSSQNVTEFEMFKELERLLNIGWILEVHGETLLRGITIKEK